MRLFYALWPDDATRTALTQLQVAMHGRLICYQDLHLTLAFLGTCPEAVLPDLADVLAQLPRSDVTLKLDRVGYFPRNRVAWAGSSETPQALLDLHTALKRGLAARSLQWNEQQAFKPHVTLARDAVLASDIVFAPIPWRVRRVCLARSNSQANGARYEVLASRSLDEFVRVPDPGEDAPLLA